ncbi:saccharopine dehydrogenase (NAD+, L-lysine-forming) [Loktanella fryxellensis]|uniref:Saccharopine dehydrogenase [NAD(+), L-lysine-forming] n=1 Tax=Loktanella fryxellensis TaxID=245187 RepID=A0A1H7ZWJ9_9RHOB|nr:saccharopine dehydrogenase [Loktanella fryxellensis]SEM61958.1 saccharopine dehydrogenase (NAD+, L-lysine-forming) [Loktanella fryxellensis]
MTHLWVRAESRDHEARVGIMPEGVAALVKAGLTVTVEDSRQRCVPIADYAAAGATVAAEGAWVDAPLDALIFGLKELPADGTPLRHTHIMFGHAYKGQPDGRVLLDRFRAGGGRLLDLEYLVDDSGRRVAAFGYWAGYAGAAVSLMAWMAQQRGSPMGPVRAVASQTHLLADLQGDLVQLGTERPTALIIGALGRVGTGAADLCRDMGVATTLWDMADTASGGPFPQILTHELFLNCILARPGTPVFVPASAKVAPRRLSVIGDIACDPDSDFSPIKVYDRVTTWDAPALRVHDAPVLDVTAIDNLPSLMPRESSQDFADQLLPHLATPASDVWARASHLFDRAMRPGDLT